MRVMVHDKWKFPGGFYIFEKTGSQVNPDTPEGKNILEILTRQKLDKEVNKPHKYRAEVSHNKDIDGDGVIGDPSDKVVPIAVLKKAKKKKTKKRWI